MKAQSNFFKLFYITNVQYLHSNNKYYYDNYYCYCSAGTVQYIIIIRNFKTYCKEEENAKHTHTLTHDKLKILNYDNQQLCYYATAMYFSVTGIKLDTRFMTQGLY